MSPCAHTWTFTGSESGCSILKLTYIKAYSFPFEASSVIHVQSVSVTQLNDLQQSGGSTPPDCPEHAYSQFMYSTSVWQIVSAHYSGEALFMHNSSSSRHSTWTFSNPFEVNSLFVINSLARSGCVLQIKIVCVARVGRSHLSEVVLLYNTGVLSRFTPDKTRCTKSMCNIFDLQKTSRWCLTCFTHSSCNWITKASEKIRRSFNRIFKHKSVGSDQMTSNWNPEQNSWF